jgi:2,3,4,5-tetrahydropyridine-2-carboxylate N-succinyltransferase
MDKESAHQACIEAGFAAINDLGQESRPALKQAVKSVLAALDQGRLSVVAKVDGDWTVHAWIKKAILLHFKLSSNTLGETAQGQFYDKVALKFANMSADDFERAQIRVVPGAIVREGVYIGPNTVLMPSFVNIGAHIGQGCMIDTWATVGSCAYLGEHVHLSGGAGIGGVLEPLQASPTIIEDHCFIGARSEIVEGVIVERGSVISMGVYLSQSTRILNRATGEVSYGCIPAGSVVVPGHMPSVSGEHGLACAVIVKQVDDKTRAKVSVNELLRETSVDL